ncbi:MAG: GNAT family N-acetyltransferase [Alphaproteobacteria bacterium]|nr:GNAT family N-acetyltransferase [Alphaproteobacteria bacterium]
MTNITLRPAVKEDSATIAQLFLISSDGLAEYIWTQLAEPGEAVIDVGARRYARDGVFFSYQHCLMAEAGGVIVGMFHCFPMEEDPDAAPKSDPVLRPYSELEDYGSLYISSVAVIPDHRGKGIGSQLLAAAVERAKKMDLPRLSLICFERNEDALRLYLRLGYTEIDRRTVVPHPTLHYADGGAILLALNVD